MKPSIKSKTKSKQQSHQKTISQVGSTFQLPKINKTLNDDTTSNISYEFETNQKEYYFKLDQIRQNQREQIGIINYNQMNIEQIQLQYQRLRQEYHQLTNSINKKQQITKQQITKQQTTKSRVSKKTNTRRINHEETQKKIAQLTRDIYDNNYLLTKLRQQYEQMYNRNSLANSSLSKPNITINDKVLQMKEKILTIKQKIKLLKRKTKKGGESIVNGDNIHEEMDKLVRQQKVYLSKQANLQIKLQQSIYKLQQDQIRLQQILPRCNEAQQHLKLFRLQHQQTTQQSGLTVQYRQREYRIQILNKKIQSDQQSYLQKYHQLLKNFQLQAEIQEKSNKKLIDGDIRILKAANIILQLQQEDQQLNDLILRLDQQNSLMKQAESLRNMMENQTYNKYTTTKISAVSSIIQQNQSDIRDTIQNLDKYQQKINEHQRSQKQLALVQPERVRALYTKVQRISSTQNKLQNSQKNKYFLSSKQINRKRQQQHNKTSLKKQSAINTKISNRKTHSLLDKIQHIKKQRSSLVNKSNFVNQDLNNVNVTNLKYALENNLQSEKYPSQKYQKNYHTQAISKGKQAIRQRKISLKVIQNQPNKLKEDQNRLKVYQNKLKVEQNMVKVDYNQIKAQTINAPEQNIYLLQQLEQINRKLLAESEQQIKTKSTYLERVIKKIATSQQSNRSIGRIVPTSTKQSRYSSRRSIKPQVLQQIDKNNIQYSQKIDKMKKQMSLNKQEDRRSSSQQLNMVTMEIQPQRLNDHVVSRDKDEQLSIDLHDQQDHKQDNKIVQIQNQHDFNNKAILQNQLKMNKKEVYSDKQSQQSDIEEDISQINKMIKLKMQANTIHQS